VQVKEERGREKKMKDNSCPEAMECLINYH